MSTFDDLVFVSTESTSNSSRVDEEGMGGENASLTAFQSATIYFKRIEDRIGNTVLATMRKCVRIAETIVFNGDDFVTTLCEHMLDTRVNEEMNHEKEAGTNPSLGEQEMNHIPTTLFHERRNRLEATGLSPMYRMLQAFLGAKREEIETELNKRQDPALSVDLLAKVVEEIVEIRVQRTMEQLLLDPSVELHIRELFLAELKTAQSIQMFTVVLGADVECPAMVAMNDWLLEQTETIPNWSMIRPVEDLVDSTLSFFGNCVARDMLMLEFLFAVTSVHEEILLTQITSLLACDVSVEEKLRIHLLFSGPSSSSKTFIQKTQKELTIPGLIHSHDTAPTGNQQPGFQLHVDGLDATVMRRRTSQPKKLKTNKDHAPKQLFKSIMEQKCQHIAETNLGFYRLLPAIASLFAKFPIPLRDRPGADSIAHRFHLQSDETALRAKMRYRDEWYLRQLNASHLLLWSRLIPGFTIDTEIVQKLSPIAFRYLKEQGITVEHCDQVHVYSHVKAVCLYEAISRVCFTQSHFPTGTPYDYCQILEAIPYLTCTREHFWFGFSQMFPSFVSPCLDVVVDAIAEMISEEEEVEKRFAQHTKRAKVVVNYNYYLLLDASESVKLPAEPIDNDDLLECATSKISERIKRYGTMTWSGESVMDVLIWMKAQTIHSVLYTGPKTSDYSQTNLTNIEVLRQTKGRFGGLEISRAFLNKRSSQSSMSLLESCIRSTMDAVPLVKGVVPRAVLGTSLRTGHCKGTMLELEAPSAKNTVVATSTSEVTWKTRPHLLKCIAITPRVPITTVRRVYRPFGAALVVNIDEKQLRVDSSADAKENDWTIRVEPVAERVNYLMHGDYPERFEDVE